MLKWFIISFAVIIVIIAGLIATLYYLIFVKDVGYSSAYTYDSDEQAVTSAISDMLDGLLGIELTPAQETELEELIGGYSAGTSTLDDLQAFILDEETGVMATNSISLTGGLAVEVNEGQLTGLINLLVGNIDTMLDTGIVGLSSEDGALIYTIAGMGDVKLSGIGVNINESSIAIVFTVTLPEFIDIPVVGPLFGGKTISIGLNPTIDVAEDGTVAIDLNLDGLKIGGISVNWPGISYGMGYVKDIIVEGRTLGEMLQQSVNVTDALQQVLPVDLGLSLSVAQGKMSFVGPPTIASGLREIDYGTQTQEEVAGAATEAIDDFITGATDTLVLEEEEITALLVENIENVLAETPEIDIELTEFTVNVDEEGLSLATTVTIPEITELELPSGLAGSEIEIGLIIADKVDDDGNTSLVVVGLDLGGLPDEVLEEFGLDTEALNEQLADAGFDLGDALGLPEGALEGISLGDGDLTLTASD